jgi:hypothetical protein
MFAGSPPSAAWVETQASSTRRVVVVGSSTMSVSSASWQEVKPSNGAPTNWPSIVLSTGAAEGIAA